MTRPERLRLLLVSAASGAFGAPERVLWELGTRLPETRYTVAAWLPPASEMDELAHALEGGGVEVERLPEPRSRWDFRRLSAVRSMLRRWRPAILHLHTDASGGQRGLPSLARLLGVPHRVVTHHGLPGWEPWPALATVDAVTAVCGSAGEGLIRTHGIARARLRIVTHGVDAPDDEAELMPSRRLRDSIGAGPFRPLWVCAARLEDIKGHEILLDALHRLTLEGLDFVVALAGEGARRAGLERRAGELGLASRVHFLGAVDALGPWLRAADVVVLPSREEALPLSVLEAMARDRPVVASAVGGLLDAIEDGVHGLLVPAGDAAALAGALGTLHRKPDLGRRLGLNAADRTRGAFTWEHVIGRYEAVYDEVLGLAGFTPEPAGGKSRPGAEPRR